MPFITFSVTILGAFLKAIAQVVRIEIEASLKKNRNHLKISKKMTVGDFLLFPKPGRGSFATNYRAAGEW